MQHSSLEDLAIAVLIPCYNEEQTIGDVVSRFRATLLRDRVMNDGEIAAMRQRVAAELDAAIAFAQAAPWPDAREVAVDVHV